MPRDELLEPDRNTQDLLDEAEAGVAYERAIRPRSLEEFVGQAELKERLGIILDAARARNRAADHLLFAGPPGLGKTTLAGIVAGELGAHLTTTSGPAIERPADLANILTNLEAGDVLFIDSSHVSKIGSDVNRIYFDILPRLAPGVHVHIHDVAGNFEYPREWLAEGRAWNEQYLLRAFLLFNDTFEVELLTGWLFNHHQEFFRARMPLCLRGGGGQIWLRRAR